MSSDMLQRMSLFSSKTLGYVILYKLLRLYTDSSFDVWILLESCVTVCLSPSYWYLCVLSAVIREVMSLISEIIIKLRTFYHVSRTRYKVCGRT